MYLPTQRAGLKFEGQYNLVAIEKKT